MCNVLTEPEGLSPSSQKPSTASYPEPVRTNSNTAFSIAWAVPKALKNMNFIYIYIYVYINYL
jgi:hypothetical protein